MNDSRPERLFIGLAGLGVALASLVLLLTPWPALALLPPMLLPVMLAFGRHPQYAYFFIIALIPLTSWRTLTDQYRFLTVSKFLGVYLIIIMLIRMAMRPALIGRVRSKVWIPLAGFALAAILSALMVTATPFSEHAGSVALDNLRQLLTAYVFLALTLFFVGERELRVTVPAIIVASTSISTFMAVIGQVFGIDSLSLKVHNGAIQARAVGAAMDPNFFAAMILSGLPFIAHYAVRARSNLARILWIGLLVHNSYALIITYSRGVLIVFMVAGLLILIENLRRVRPRHLGFVTVLFAVALTTGYLKLPGSAVWERMESLSTPHTDLALVRRGSYLEVAREAIRRNPLMGSGIGVFPELYRQTNFASAYGSQRSGYARMAHNTYLEVVVGTGFVGLLFFIAALWMAIRCLLRAQRECFIAGRTMDAAFMRSVLYAFLTFLTSLVFLSDLYHKYIWLFLGLGMAACQIVQREVRRDEAASAP